jgi:hypothetical protein
MLAFVKRLCRPASSGGSHIAWRSYEGMADKLVAGGPVFLYY